jgi:hypothetical protein
MIATPVVDSHSLMRASCHFRTTLLLAGLTLSGPLLGQQQNGDTEEVFVDRAASAGLDFVHFNGMSGEYYYPEAIGSGGALLDYDNDGDLDVYLVQGTMAGPGKTIDQATLAPRHPLPLTDRLYRNDTRRDENGSPLLAFTDVTEQAGLSGSFYGMGAATGDYNNDGWLDIYITNFGPNQLLKNNGDGTFTDVTARAGVGDTRWSVAASFFDYDGDGWLDLYAANYVDFTYSLHKTCTRASGAQDYCGPLAYDGVPDRLFRNRGDGTFEDVSVRAGVNADYGGALGVVAADFNDDGRPDIYVANDLTPNHLWLNQGDGTFVDDALLAGGAVNRHGQAEASMGIAAEDFDADGDIDLLLTHLIGQSNTLYINQGSGFFQDRTLEHGLATPSWNYTGFGTGWFDYDGDGRFDLLVVNGDVKGVDALLQIHDPYPLHQPNQLYRNIGENLFEETTATAGAVFELSEVSRGAAFGDIDNDGDTDVLVVNNSGPARLLINQIGNTHGWIGLRLVGKDLPRDMIGAHITLYRAGQPAMFRRVHSDSSFASASDLRLHFGLGTAAVVDRIEVRWPSGAVESFDDVEVGSYNEVRQGTGRAVIQ